MEMAQHSGVTARVDTSGRSLGPAALPALGRDGNGDCSRFPL